MKNLLILFFSALVLTNAGCKKSKERKPECYLTVVTPKTGDVLNFYYDSEGRVISIKQSPYSYDFTYKGDSVIILKNQPMGFGQRFRSKLNAQGLPLSVRIEDNESGSEWYLFEFEYKGTEVQKQTYTTHYGTIPSIVNYEWSNGNLINKKNSGNIWKYEYFTDEPIRQGDAFAFDKRFEFGGQTIVRNKNLLKKMEHTLLTVGTETNTYEYSFDKDGKILTMFWNSESTPGKYPYNMQYQCK